MESEFYNRHGQGCHFIDDEKPGLYRVFEADGNFMCITDLEGAVNVCEFLEYRR